MAQELQYITVDTNATITMEQAMKFASVLPALKKAHAMQEAGTKMDVGYFINYTKSAGTRSHKEAAFLMHEMTRDLPSVIQITQADVAA